MSSTPDLADDEPGRRGLGGPGPVPRQAAKSIVGIVCSKREATADILPALQLLKTLKVGSSIFEMPFTGVGGFAQWAAQLRRSGGVAIWALVSGDLEIVHKVAAVDTDLPMFCQAVGPNADELQVALVPRLRELPAAMLYARRLQEAAITIARVAAIADPYVEKRLREYRAREISRAAKKSDRIGATSEFTDLPQGFVQTVTVNVKPPEYDDEIISPAEMKPRVASKTEKAKAPASKAFDYSMQLRQVLTAAREIAAAYRNPQVAPEHLLAAVIDTPEAAAHLLLVNAGVNLEALAGHLIPHFPPPHESEVSGMFSMADSTWTVLENARSIARERKRPCLTTLDFLESIALRTSSGATSALWESGLLATQLDEAINKADPKHEYESIKPREGDPVPTGIDAQMARELQSRLDKSSEQISEEETPQPQGFSPDPKPKPDILRCSPDNPELEVVETVADALLEGRLVAFPMDTMMALAADATNPAAVQRLRQAVQSDASRHLGAVIHSTMQLKHLVKNVPGAVLKMLGELWPGPLTVVFDRHPHRFAHLSSEPTLGLRIPNDYLSLAILSTAGRPLAVTSIQLADGEGAKHVAEKYAGVVDIVIDTGEPPGDATTTVLSVAAGEQKLLREGSTAQTKIEEHLGKLDSKE